MTHMHQLPTDDNGELSAYAWTGGYPILYLDTSNDVLCPTCAQEALIDGSDPPVAWMIHWEGGPETCADCVCELESAYGE